MKIILLSIILMGSTGCVSTGIGTYVVNNAHLETKPSGAGVCLGLPFFDSEVCLTGQKKDPEGDINIFSFLGGNRE